MSDEAFDSQDDNNHESGANKKRKPDSDVDGDAPGSKRQKTSESSAMPLKKRFQQNDNDTMENDEDSDFQEEADPYDEDGFLNEDDRLEIEALNNMEREKIMMDRQDERNRIREMNRMRREKWEADRRAKGLSTAPKSAAAAKKSESSRKKAAMSALAARYQAKKPTTSRRRDMDEDIYDDQDDREDDDYGNDDDDEDFGSRSRSRAKESKRSSTSSVRDSGRDLRRSPPPPMVREPLATFEDFKKAQVLRTKLVQWSGEPFFEKAVNGLYVRVSLGEDPTKPGQAVYRIAQVTGVQETTKPYAVSGSSKPIPYRLVATIGTSSRPFSFEHISASEITQQEFDDYCRFLKRAPMSLPTRREIEAIIQQIKDADNYRYSSSEIQQMIATSGFKNVNRQKRRLELQQERIAAEDAGDREKVARVDAQLAELQADEDNEKSRQDGASKRRSTVDMDTPKPKPSLFAEVAALQGLSPFDPKNGKSKSEEKSNPFARRRTLQDNGWAKNLSKAASQQIEAAATTPEVLQETKSTSSAVPANVWDLEDITPTAPAVAAPLFVAPIAAKPSAGPVKTLSLADYLKNKKN